MIDPKRLGRRIKRARLSLCLSQQKLADEINISQKAISRYEHGLMTPTLGTFIKLCKKLGLELGLKDFL